MDDLPPSTAKIDNYFYKIAPNDVSSSAYGIEIAGSSLQNGAIADMSLYNVEEPNKVFALYKNGDYYYIVNINSWMALDCGGPSTASGQQVHQ